ncbi:hypothetical protein BOW19_11575 [Solemya velum gill symbiont]|nr:hypothetical protein BOW19_11575 [Solemya velum gill symbiont]
MGKQGLKDMLVIEAYISEISGVGGELKVDHLQQCTDFQQVRWEKPQDKFVEHCVVLFSGDGGMFCERYRKLGYRNQVSNE